MRQRDFAVQLCETLGFWVKFLIGGIRGIPENRRAVRYGRKMRMIPVSVYDVTNSQKYYVTSKGYTNIDV